MSNPSNPLKTLRSCRPLLLACEAIGWLHMVGKAKADFLRQHGGQPNNYDYQRWFEQETPPFPWSDLLRWVKDKYPLKDGAWPDSLTGFVSEHTKRNPGLLGLLQAGHGMASGIEKNIPASTSGYLGQGVTHMWLTTAFGHPVRNLLQHPPEVLTAQGWQRLVGEIKHILEKLQKLGQNGVDDKDAWWQWRERAIGEKSYLRQAFLSTLAETRLPNNDVTLWDQSYVAGALFKSAVAGALLDPGFPWERADIKSATRWRVLTVGFGTRHYEARAVKIGDWTGAQRDIVAFFVEVRKFIEVDIAVGSLVYQDDETLVFTFPGLSEDGKVGLDEELAKQLQKDIEQKIDELARGKNFETPPLCRLSDSTRSFAGMVKELREARNKLAIPLHRSWTIQSPQGQSGSAEQIASQPTRHVCPVCQVRLSEPKHNDRTDNVRKSRLCRVCDQRRRGRLDAWLQGEEETVWIGEVADENDRVALLTLSLDIEPWLEGERVDSLRAQSIAEWRKFNPTLSEYWKRNPQDRKTFDNPIDPQKPYESVQEHLLKLAKDLRSKDYRLDTNSLDIVLANLQEGYRHAKSLVAFFNQVVEDRAQGVQWDEKDLAKNARWLAHQLFRKLPSPGRVYRFWRNAETFFQELLARFREIVSEHSNRWRVRRLALVPDNPQNWEDREIYSARWREAPLELLWLRDKGYFITISNLARCLEAQETRGGFQKALQEKRPHIFDDNGQPHVLTVKKVDEP